MRTADFPTPRPRGPHTSSGTGLHLRFAGATDQGLVRTGNEDAYLLDPGAGLFAVADGMGGHAAGEVASAIAVEVLSAYFRETASAAFEHMRMPYPLPAGLTPPERRLATAVKLANTTIFQSALGDESRSGMGTTLVALYFDEGIAHWAHVGDSRLYRFRNDHLMQLTEDHSLLNEAIAQSPLQGAELHDFIESFPHKNVLTRALGVRYIVDVDTSHSAARDRDLFLMVSDGVYGMLEDAEILHTLVEHRADLQRVCDTLIARANARGGSDNSTVVIVEARTPHH